MNVELPDGMILEDVPDGTTKDQLRAKLQANGYDVSKLGESPTATPAAAPASEPSLRDTITKAAQGVYAPLTYAQDAAMGVVKDLGVGAAKGVAELGTLGDRFAYRAGLYKHHFPETTPAIDKAYDEAGPAAALTRAVPSMAALGPAGRLGALADIGANAGYSALEGYANGEDPGAAALKGGAGATAGRFFPKALGATAKAGRGAVNRLTSGITPEAQSLMAQGITPTYGQAFGPGIVSTLEDASKHLPGYGSAVQKAQLRTGAQYAAREVTDAMAPMGAKIDEQGFKAVARANDILKQSYEQVVPDTFLTPQALDSALNQTRAYVQNHPLMTDTQRAQMAQWVNQKLYPVLQGAQQQGIPVPGRVARDLDIEMGNLARKFNGADPATHALGDGFAELQKNLRFALGATDPTVKAQLQATNQAFANMVPVATAFDRAGGKVPTPDQFRRAQQGGGALDLSGTPLNTAAMGVIDPRRSGGLARSAGGVGATGALFAGHPAPLAGVIAGSALGHAAYSEPVTRTVLSKMQLLPHIRQWVEGLPAARQAEFVARMVNEDPMTRQLVTQVGRQLATQQGAAQ